MAQMIESMSQLKGILKNRASQALGMTIDEIYNVFQKYINESAFSGDSSLIYQNTYKLLNSLIKTDVIQSGNEISCKIELNPVFLNYTYKNNSTSLDWSIRRNTKSRVTISDSYVDLWNNSIEAIGGREGIMKLLKSNLKKCDVPVIN